MAVISAAPNCNRLQNICFAGARTSQFEATGHSGLTPMPDEPSSKKGEGPIRGRSAGEPDVLGEHMAPRLVVHLRLERVPVPQRHGSVRGGTLVDLIDESI